jgi:hypothetical protein
MTRPDHTPRSSFRGTSASIEGLRIVQSLAWLVTVCLLILGRAERDSTPPPFHPSTAEAVRFGMSISLENYSLRNTEAGSVCAADQAW